jgi:hypothetical protein
MSLAIRLMPEPVRSLSWDVLDNAYIGLGTAMTRPIRMIVLQNLTDANAMISFDGVTDHLPLVTFGYLVLDITSNKTIPQGFFFGEGQRVYAKKLTPAENPTVYGIYLTTFYGAEV